MYWVMRTMFTMLGGKLENGEEGRGLRRGE